MKLLSLCLAVTTVLALPTNAAPDQKESCRKFVGEFYVWYLKHSNGGPLDKAVKLKKANFSPQLLRALEEDRRAAEKSPHEIVGLEFDPVLNSQDFAEKYIPGKVTQKGGRFLVEVHSVYDGKKSEVPAVTPELRHEGSRWVFINFHYKYENKSDDLLSMLKQLKADRAKHK